MLDERQRRLRGQLARASAQQDWGLHARYEQEFYYLKAARALREMTAQYGLTTAQCIELAEIINEAGSADA